MSLRHGVIDLGFRLLGATSVHKAAARFSRGLGAILMLHRVRAPTDASFAPNRGLEITPTFLDAMLAHLRAEGFDIVDLETALARIKGDASGDRPFVALTFDDGYRDTLDVALPILERHNAPFTVYVTTGFADRSARMWWVDLEAAIATLSRVKIKVAGRDFDLPAGDAQQKQAAFEALYWPLRAGPEEQLRCVAAELATAAGCDGAELVDQLCLDWAGLRRLADHRLATIGVHTLTHPMLAKHSYIAVVQELGESRQIIERQIGRPAVHLAYPVGDPSSAGPREFALARNLDFSSAVTTRPGMLFPEHRAHLCALPRLSINGAHQTLASLDILLSGVPFWLWNRGRKLAIA